MRIPLKLNSIDQEHLQELYDSTGVARDQLPYSEDFETIWQGFQDRTFKNAEREQVFGAMLKYTRSSTNSSTELAASTLTDEHRKQLKALLPRHSRAGKVLPYSDEFDAVHKEFNKLASLSLSQQEFWQALMSLQGAKRRPPKRAKVAAAPVEDDDEE